MLDIPQPCRPPGPVTGIALFFCVVFIVCNVSFIVCVALCAVVCLRVMCCFVRYVYLYAVSYCSITVTGEKKQFAVQLNNNSNNNNLF
jgi:hypothetical protein